MTAAIKITAQRSLDHAMPLALEFHVKTAGLPVRKFVEVRGEHGEIFAMCMDDFRRLMLFVENYYR